MNERHNMEMQILAEVARSLRFDLWRLKPGLERERYSGRLIRSCSLIVVANRKIRVWMGLDLERGQYELYLKRMQSSSAFRFNEVLVARSLYDPESLTKKALLGGIGQARKFGPPIYEIAIAIQACL